MARLSIEEKGFTFWKETAKETPQIYSAILMCWLVERNNYVTEKGYALTRDANVFYDSNLSFLKYYNVDTQTWILGDKDRIPEYWAYLPNPVKNDAV